MLRLRQTFPTVMSPPATDLAAVVRIFPRWYKLNSLHSPILKHAAKGKSTAGIPSAGESLAYQRPTARLIVAESCDIIREVQAMHR